ncbi:MAG TPA: hypothetical protein VK458_20015 [Myxococcaceae bacterium]|nr:hypothetical protein [Myxococcaceae bacterium]
MGAISADAILECSRTTGTGQQVGTEVRLPGLRGIAWAEGDIRPGIVFYTVQPDGTLQALWNAQTDPKCRNGLGTGKAIRQDAGQGVAGHYHITYSHPDGKELPALALELKQEQGTRYTLFWRTLEEKVLQFEGVGVWMEQKKMLVAVWWMPPREKLSLEVFVDPSPAA